MIFWPRRSRPCRRRGPFYTLEYTWYLVYTSILLYCTFLVFSIWFTSYSGNTRQAINTFDSTTPSCAIFTRTRFFVNGFRLLGGPSLMDMVRGHYYSRCGSPGCVCCAGYTSEPHTHEKFRSSNAYDSDLHIHKLLPRSRPLRRICSAYRPTSHPFSARNCRREHFVGEQNVPEVLRFLRFLYRSFFVFIPVFRCLTFFQLRERVTAVRFWFSFLYPHKRRVETKHVTE